MTREYFSDETTSAEPKKNTREFFEEQPDLPQTYAEEKPRKSIIDQGLAVAKESLVGGISGAFAPEVIQKTGQAIKTGGRAPTSLPMNVKSREYVSSMKLCPKKTGLSSTEISRSPKIWRM